MADYEPLDLSRWCNEGASLLGDDEGVKGPQTFRGLPFLVGGSSGDNCLIALSGSDESVTIPIGRKADRVIFAHRMLESELP